MGKKAVLAEYLKEKTVLKETLVKLKANRDTTEERAEKWLELTEQTFHFSTYARQAFLSGDL